MSLHYELIASRIKDTYRKQTFYWILKKKDYLDIISENKGITILRNVIRENVNSPHTHTYIRIYMCMCECPFMYARARVCVCLFV